MRSTALHENFIGETWLVLDKGRVLTPVFNMGQMLLALIEN